MSNDDLKRLELTVSLFEAPSSSKGVNGIIGLRLYGKGEGVYKRFECDHSVLCSTTVKTKVPPHLADLESNIYIYIYIITCY